VRWRTAESDRSGPAWLRLASEKTDPDSALEQAMIDSGMKKTSSSNGQGPVDFNAEAWFPRPI
jgi:hypothetical protein